MSVLVVSGCFNPVTKAHVRLAEKAYEHALSINMEVKKIIFSPVHDSYPYKHVMPGVHRVEMLKLAISSSQLRDLMDINYDEVFNPNGYVPMDEQLDQLHEKTQSQITVVSGADLVSGMSNPDYWPEEDVRRFY